MVNRCYNRHMTDKVLTMKTAGEMAGMDPAALRRVLIKLNRIGELPSEWFYADGRGYVVKEMWLKGWLACKKVTPHSGPGRPAKKKDGKQNES